MCHKKMSLKVDFKVAFSVEGGREAGKQAGSERAQFLMAMGIINPSLDHRLDEGFLVRYGTPAEVCRLGPTWTIYGRATRSILRVNPSSNQN